MHRSRTSWLATAVLAAVAACGGPRPDQTALDARSSLRGTVLAPSWPKPDFTLTDTDGRPFDFRPETDGFVTLLFFGYTHCPDVCPVHMGNIAAVLGDLDYADRSRIRVVFITTDPERDTRPALREWLDRFDTSFVGLRGDWEEVDEIQAALHLPAAVRQPSRPGPLPGAYAVGHAAQVIAFTADGRARVVYPFGTRQADWAHDLPKLVNAGVWPEGEAEAATAAR
jgi:protein SCO1/2